MSKELQTISHLNPGGNIDEYISGILRIPILEQAEERELLLDFCNYSNVESARKIILSHLRFVVYIARGYRNYGIGFADLIQEGNVGLMKALKRFDANKYEVRFTTFAVHWIKAEIHDFIIKNWRIVKVATTRSQRKLFFKLRSKKSKINWLNDEEIIAIAKDLDVEEKDVRTMEKRLAAGDIPIELDSDDSEDNQVAPILYLEDNRFEPSRIFESLSETNQTVSDIHSAIKILDKRSQDIIKKRWLQDKKMTLKDLSKEYKVSMERIRQIEEIAFKKISKRLEHLKETFEDEFED